jgi:hypothetical protein
MNGEARLQLFTTFISLEFLKADQLWAVGQWEALRNSPFPAVSALPLPTSPVPPDPDPTSPHPAP